MTTATEFYQRYQNKAATEESSYSVPSLSCWVCRDSGIVRHPQKFIHDPEMLDFFLGFAIACGCQEGRYKDAKTHLVLDEITPHACEVISEELRQQELEFAKAQAQGIVSPEVEAMKSRLAELTQNMTLSKAMAAPERLSHKDLMILDRSLKNATSAATTTNPNDEEDIPF